MVSRFFRVIINEKEESKFLRLPPKFARLNKRVAGQECHIEDSTGRLWSVTVSNVNGSLAFDKGWDRFYMDHHLQVGVFMVFSYIERSHFIVQIYDRSACEKIDFGNIRALPSKRPRRDPASVHTNPSVVDAVAFGSEFSTPLAPPSTNMEEQVSMMNRDYGYDQGEERTLLYDLSSFEMGKQPSISNAIKHGLDTKIAPSPAEFKGTLDAEIAPSGTQFINGADKFGKALDKKVALSDAEARDNADKLVKTLETNVAPLSHAVSKTKEADIEMAATHTDQIKGSSGDISVDKAHNKHSENNKLSKDTRNDAPNFQYNDYPVSASVTETSSSGSSKNALHGFREPSFSSQGRKNSVDSRSIKKKRFELEDDARGLPEVSFRKKPTMGTKHGQIFSSAVKVEPDSPPTVSVPSFTAEVKSLSYLEVAVKIPSIPGRRDNKGRAKAVYLRDPVGRLWPVLYLTLRYAKALTSNWGRFCETNKIKVGDVCRFEVENETSGIYKVSVRSRSC